MTKLLEGKTIIVTGGAGGIGRAASLVMARHGANVVVTDITDAGENVVAEIAGAGGFAAFVQADVSDDASAANLVAKTLELFGRLDGAFNNAGIQVPPCDAAAEPADVFDRVNAINLRGVWASMKHEPLAWNTLTEAAAWLSSITGEEWTPRRVLDAALSFPVGQNPPGASNLKTAIHAAMKQIGRVHV